MSRKRGRGDAACGLVGFKYVSDSALAGILDHLKNSDVDVRQVTGISRRNLKRRLETEIDEQTVYGPVLTTIDLPLADGSGPFRWWVPNPPALLRSLAKTNFGVALWDAHQLRPSSPSRPWGVLYNADECTTGNLLRRDPARKAWNVYWSFLELGREILSQDNAWLIGGVLRRSNEKLVEGEFETAFVQHLLFFFGGDFALQNGIALDTPRGSVVLYATLRFVPADELGLKVMFGVKGASGQRCCAKCCNVVNNRSGLAARLGGRMVDIACSDPRRFLLHSNASMHHYSDRVHAAGLSNAARRRLSTQVGFNFNPRGVLQTLLLRTVVLPAECYYFDFVHTLLSGGTAALEVELFLEHCNEDGVLKPADVAGFVAGVVWPKHISRPKIKDNMSSLTDLRASELLSFIPVLRTLVRDRLPAGTLRPQQLSFVAMCCVLDKCANIQRGESADGLANLMGVWLDFFKAAYTTAPRPKHHFGFHLEDQANASAIDGRPFMIGCFVTERRHKLFKGFAAHITRKDGLEKSVLVNLLAAHRRSLGESPFKTGVQLVRPAERVLEGTVIQTSLEAFVNGVTVSVGDMIYTSESSVAEVLLLFELSGGLCAHVCWYFLVDGRRNVWARDGTQETIRLDDVLSPAAWAYEPLGRMIVKPSFLGAV